MIRCARPVVTRVLIAAGPERRAHVRHQRSRCSLPHGHDGPHLHLTPRSPGVLEGAGASGYSVGHPSTRGRDQHTRDGQPVTVAWCPCECNSGGFCGGCGHAGCSGGVNLTRR